MNLDVRLPMGLLFALIGAILVIHGLSSDQAIYAQHSLGININIRWGFVLLAFAAVMLFLVWRSKSKAEKS